MGHSKHDLKRTAGRCIYCGDMQGPLSAEHIVAKGMGGLLTPKGHMTVLYQASCPKCAKVTREIEAAAIREMDVMRQKSGIRKSHGGSYPSHYEMMNPNEEPSSRTRKLLLAAEEYPVWAMVPVFNGPPIPPGSPAPPKMPQYTYNLLLDSKEKVQRTGMSFFANSDLRAQILTVFKIAHAYLFYTFWPKVHFESFLHEFFESEPPDPSNARWHLIGSSTRKLKFDRFPHVHLVEHSIDEGNGPRLIRVYIRLFSHHTGNHTFEVIAGQLSAKQGS